MKKKFLTALLVLVFTFIAPCGSFAVTRQEMEQIMHTLIPSSKGIATSPLTVRVGAKLQEQLEEPSITLEQESLANDPYSYTEPPKNEADTQNQEQQSDETATQSTQGAEATPQSQQAPQAEPPQPQLTRQEVFLTCLNKMGWTPTLALLRKLASFSEYSNVAPTYIVLSNIRPAPPQELFAKADEIFPSEDLAKLTEWLRLCSRNVKMEAKLTRNGNSIYVIKSGVPTPSGRVQDMWARNIPLFIVYYAQNTRQNFAHIAIAEQMGYDKLPLATIAAQTQGAEFAINGGYFGAGKGQIIGVLRSRGNTVRSKFWRNRSGLAWNDNGEHMFFDGKNTQLSLDNQDFAQYTEIFQAGPMLIFNGQVSQNSEDIHKDVIEKRHPRTFVAEQPDGTIVWGIVDGRSASHSVGMTIKELRSFCKKRNFTNALNLDGGGSSSIWWNGLTFSRPCNQLGCERKIPYAILIYNSQASLDGTASSKNTTPRGRINIAPTISIPKQDDYNVTPTIVLPKSE